MEVHHHSNTSAKEKHFRHYLFEFLMLFLAVFCGFMAENWREHIVEHRREKKFMQSLVSDLAADTTRLTEIIRQRQNRDAMLDSFIILLNRPDAVASSRYLYYFNSFATREWAFRFTPVDGTMQQLKNGGNLRLVRNSAVSDSIVAYDVATRAIVYNNQNENQIIDTYRNIAEGMFDGRVLNAMRSADNATVIMPDHDPSLRLSADAVFRLTYRIHMLTVFNKSLGSLSIQMKQEATNLLALIKNEYPLK